MLILPTKLYHSARERERERESKRRVTLVGIGAGVLLAIVAVLISPLGSSLVSAIQNIFIDGSQIIDIQVGGEKIDQVVFRGEVIWERVPQLNFIQEITTANCPTVRTLAVDARDNATYWVQKLADGRCWMLTNLAYGGGGANTYNDVKAITNAETSSYTEPYYMIPPNANRTVSPQEPSVSTDGGVTNPQYGYLYNWCAAMGVQTGTAACMNALAPVPDPNISICPSGWRLPGGGATATTTGNDFGVLNAALNNGSASSLAGLLYPWLGMYGGFWEYDFNNRGISGDYWSSTQSAATNAYYLYFDFLSSVAPGTYNYNKQYGFAVRCVAI